MQMLPVVAEVVGGGEGEETPVASVELQIYHHLISIWRRAVLMMLLTTLKSSSRGGRDDRQRDSGTDRQTDRHTVGWMGGRMESQLSFWLRFAFSHCICSVSSFAVRRLPFAACRLL